MAKNRVLSHQSAYKTHAHTSILNGIFVLSRLPSFMRFFLPIVPSLSQKLSPSFLEIGVFGDFGRGDAIFSQIQQIPLVIVFKSHSQVTVSVRCECEFYLLRNLGLCLHEF